jgi:glyoxylase-like metal-dependent hydrolase (beta-lactamase superfamily II)
MAVSQIRIIKPGTIAIDGFESPTTHVLGMKYLSGIGGGSTVTWVKSDASILVDTGFDYETNLSEANIKNNHKNLIHALKNAGLAPGDIDILFITHWHVDHFLNYKIFPDSEIVMLDKAIERHNLDFTSISGRKKIAEGVEVLHTPGHTADHASILLKTENLRYTSQTSSGGRIMGIGKVNVVVAGDAIVSPTCYCMNRVWDHNQDFFSLEEGNKSMNEICKIADFIIPGHGGVFENVRKI